MSSLFGGLHQNNDIRDIVTMLTESTDSICNENVAGTSLRDLELQNMCESIETSMLDHYSPCFTEAMEGMLREDASGAAQMFLNNISDMKSFGTIGESAVPNIVTLTSSIATNMRTPYEAVLHRLFDTRTLDKQIVSIEEVIPTIMAPGSDDEEDMIDALSPRNTTQFVDKTEIAVTTLTDGIAPGKDSNKKALLSGLNTLYRLNRDVRIAKIDVAYPDSTSTPESPKPDIAVDASKIKMKRGSVPYFDATTEIATCLFEVTKDNGDVVDVHVTAKINFAKSTMEYITASEEVKKVYFYATVDHAEHTHPVRMGFRNDFQQYVVPTRPHFEVSIPQEKRTDIQNSISHFADVDIVTQLTENVTIASARMEDQRLKKCLESGNDFEAGFSFNPPTAFAHGNLEWFKREFVPYLDQIALKMKDDWNITDCHFRVAVSPYILRILDPDYQMDKSLTEESRGSGVINYSIGCKTSTSTFYFISSQAIEDNVLRILLIPNNFKNSQVKTYCYFKYSSFLTDQLRRSDSAVQPAIVYSERNLPIVFNSVQAKATISDMPITKNSGDRWINRA